jgi:hypothetical protein
MLCRGRDSGLAKPSGFAEVSEPVRGGARNEKGRKR